MTQTSTTSKTETTAITYADANEYGEYGIDLFHANVERDADTGHELNTDAISTEWLVGHDARNTDDGATWTDADADDLLTEQGYRRTGPWEDIDSPGGAAQQAPVERTA